MPRLDKLTTARRGKGRSFPQDLPIRVLGDQWLYLHPNEDLHILDVCCGRGALLGQVKNLFGPNSNRVFYHGYDIHLDFLKECEALGKQLEVRTETHVGELGALRALFGGRKYPMISLINVVHELPLVTIPDLLLDFIELCADDGSIYIFDIATLPYSEPEPGALPWRAKDVNRVLQAFSAALGFGRTAFYASAYCSNQGGWYFTINKSALGESVAAMNEEKRSEIRRTILDEILGTFRQRRDDIDEEIHSYAYELYQRTTETDASEEPGTVTRLRQQIDTEVRDFWSCVSEVKALEGGGR